MLEICTVTVYYINLKKKKKKKKKKKNCFFHSWFGRIHRQEFMAWPQTPSIKVPRLSLWVAMVDFISLSGQDISLPLDCRMIWMAIKSCKMFESCKDKPSTSIFWCLSKHWTIQVPSSLSDIPRRCSISEPPRLQAVHLALQAVDLFDVGLSCLGDRIWLTCSLVFLIGS